MVSTIVHLPVTEFWVKRVQRKQKESLHNGSTIHFDVVNGVEFFHCPRRFVPSGAGEGGVFLLIFCSVREGGYFGWPFFFGGGGGIWSRPARGRTVAAAVRESPAFHSGTPAPLQLSEGLGGPVVPQPGRPPSQKTFHWATGSRQIAHHRQGMEGTATPHGLHDECHVRDPPPRHSRASPEHLTDMYPHQFAVPLPPPRRHRAGPLRRAARRHRPAAGRPARLPRRRGVEHGASPAGCSTEHMEATRPKEDRNVDGSRLFYWADRMAANMVRISTPSRAINVFSHRLECALPVWHREFMSRR